MQRHAAIGFEADADGGGIGQRGVAAAIPHAGHADAAAASGGSGVEIRGGGAGSFPYGLQRFQAITDADTVAHDLAGDGGRIIAERVADAELEGIDPQLFRQHVEHLLLGDDGLRHAEAAEGARRC